MSPRFVAFSLALTMALGGCLSTTTSPAAIPVGTDANLQPVRLADDGGFELGVPVPVVLVGFEAGVAEALAAALEPEVVHHKDYRHETILARGEIHGEDAPMPNRLLAHFRVAAVDDAAAARFFGAVAAAPVESPHAEVYDANLAERLLVDLLETKGFAPPPGISALVVLHAGDRLPEGHAWRHTMTHGWLEPVRYFGERSALAVLDASAREDPWVRGERGLGMPGAFTKVVPPKAQAYDRPLAPGGDVTVDALATLARDVANYRLLQGALYPVSTNPCHHVTVLVAFHPHAASELLPDRRSAAEWLPADALAAAWTNLTRAPVAVEVRTLELPREDPVLETFLRAAFSPAVLVGTAGAAPLLDHVHANWKRYAGDADACESYLHIAWFPDASQRAGQTIGGIAMYGTEPGERLGISVYDDTRRFTAEHDGPFAEAVSGRDGSSLPNAPAKVVAHEVGHLMGQHHPFIVVDVQDVYHWKDVESFQSGWSSMGYQTGERLVDFGLVEHHNWARNRAAYAVEHARGLGLEGSPAFAGALEALARYDWHGAYDTLAAEPPSHRKR